MLTVISPFKENAKERMDRHFPLLRSNATWSTLHAITTQTLIQIACLPQINLVFCNIVLDLGIRNWEYQSTQYFLSFLAAAAAVFTVNTLRHRDVLVFAMAVVTVAYLGLGITFFSANEENQSTIVSVALAFHSLLSCVFPVLLLISWIYTTRLFVPEFRPAGLSLAMASRWLVDACISASFPLFLDSHRAVFFLVIGTICFCSTAILSKFPEQEDLILSGPSSIPSENCKLQKQLTGNHTLENQFTEQPTEKKSPGSSTL